MKPDTLAQWRDILRTNTATQEVIRELERNQPKAYDPNATAEGVTIEKTALRASYAQGYADCLKRLRGITEQNPTEEDSPFL